MRTRSRIPALVLASLVAAGLGPGGVAPTPAAAELRVVAATTDLGAIAKAVGGDDVTIEVVARPDRDPHIVEVRPGTMRKAARADVYLEAGLSLDLWSADIVRGSRNRDLRVIDCSSVITPLDVPQGKIDASMGDVHPQGNPHWWLDPMNGAAVARLLAKELGRVDPAHADAFAANAESFAAEIEKRLPAWDAALRGHTFVEYHASWAYLANRFGMEIAGHVEPLPGIPPTARHLAELADVIRSRHVPIVIRDPYHAASGPEFLERETGVRAVVLPASCDEPTPASYFAHFDRIARTLGAS